MSVERLICVGSGVASAILIFEIIGSLRRRKWGRACGASAGFILLNFIAASLVGPSMRGYVYQAADSKTFLEVPFKNLPYSKMLELYNATNHGQLFRTFEQDWRNYYRWHDYRTHPRWNIPYRPSSPGKQSPEAPTEVGRSSEFL